MIFQPINLILILFFSIDMIKLTIVKRQFGKEIPELFGTSFVAWVIQFEKKTINRLDFPGGFFYA